MTGRRVLFVNHTSSVSGAEMILLDVVRAVAHPSAFLFEDGPLAAKLGMTGADVILSRFGRSFSKIRRDSKLASALPMAGSLLAVAAELARAARKHDVVYANSQKAFTLGAIAAAMARRPLVWHLHDIVTSAHFGRGQRRMQVRLANSFASRVIAPSKAVAEAFELEGGRPGLARVIPNGLDIDDADDSTPKAALREALALPRGALVGVFSRLAAWKGQHVVLQALAALPNVRCIVAGAPLFGEEPYAESLHVLAAKLGIADRVQFLGQRDDVPRLMRAVDVVIHPSIAPEPFGRTLVEAMRARTPIVATDAGASRDILDGGAGWLLPAGDPSALASAIREILTADDAERASTLDRAEQRAREVYGLKTMQSAVVALIEEAAAEAGR